MVDPLPTIFAGAIVATGQPSIAVAADLVKRTESAIAQNALIPVLANIRAVALLDQDSGALDRLFRKLAAWPLAPHVANLADIDMGRGSVSLLDVYLSCLEFWTRDYETARHG